MYALYLALKGAQADVDDLKLSNKAYKKDRSFLSPDVQTQQFMGDIMFSNTYLTQRIPANFYDPE
jgi:hypothetical protein